MATLPPQSRRWPADRAVLFVHGVGNAQPGDYDPLVTQVQAALGADAPKFAFYFLYYDLLNQWVAAKLQTAKQVAALVGCIKAKLDATALGNAFADFAGDVIWPVLVADARMAVRAAVLQQLQQIVKDGQAAGVAAPNQHLTIIAHSLGCFHTYEALHAAAADPGSGLSPATWGVHFDNVIFMASPVQLIRTVATAMGKAVPQPTSLACVSQTLHMPSEPGADGDPVASARNTISITGNLDPVGGYFFRTQLPWAYMNLPGQRSFIDAEQVAMVNGVNGSEELTLANLLESALQNDGPPKITPLNPHDWSAYVARHAADLRTWLTA